SNVQSLTVTANGMVLNLNPATLVTQSGQSDVTTLNVPGSSAPLTYTVTTGSPPAGMSLSSAGVLIGTPIVPGPSTFTVQATSTSMPGIFVTQVVTQVVE